MANTSRTVKVKFDGDVKGLARAAKDGEREVDRFGKSVDKKFRKSGDDSGKGFGSGLKKWFGASGGLSKLGESGGTVFGSGFLGAIKTPVLGPAILGLLAGAVAIAAPAAGAIAASGLVLGFGAGLAGLGIMFAAKSKVVQDTWKKTLDGMGKDMTLLSKPFESTLISIAGFAQRTFDKFKPSLEAVFKEMAPAVTKFVDQVSSGLEQLQPAIRPLAEAFDAVLASLGPAIQGAIGNVSKGLQNLAESVKKNPDGLADMVDGIGTLTNKILGALAALNDFNGKIESLTNGTSAVDIVFGKANSKIGQFVISITNTLNPLHAVTDLLGLFGQKSKEAAGAVGFTGEATTYLTQGLNANQVASVLAGNAVAGTGIKAEAAGVQFARQTRATDALIASMFRLQNLALGLAGAEINYQSSVDAATASIKENGRNTDINTAKGRANKSALLDVASAANQQTQAMIESNKGTAAAGRSADTARTNFVNLAVKMGYSRAEAKKLADQLIAIPPKKNTTVSITGATDAKAKADSLANSIRLIPGYKNIQIKYSTTGVNLTAPGAAGVGRRASGGLLQPNRTYMVGERGPEPLTVGPNGAKITSNERLREVMQSTQQIVVENHIEIGGEVVRVVRAEIKDNDRNTKRRVSAGVRT